MALKRTPRVFRPRPPKLKSFASPAFLAFLFLMIAPRIAEKPTAVTVAGATGLLVLIFGGIWLQLWGRWPGKPVMTVDRSGMTYRQWGMARSLAWSDIVAMPVDFTLDRMSFVTRDGRRIHMRPGLVADDGSDWLMVIEEYWRQPRRKGCKH